VESVEKGIGVKGMKIRKLLFKQIIKCPNWHETICKVYEDNGYFYYECPICGVIVGLQRDGDKKEDINFIGGKVYRNKIEKRKSFTGHNRDEIMNLFRKRKLKKELEGK